MVPLKLTKTSAVLGMISSFQGFGEGVNVAEIIGGRFVSSIERVSLTH